MVKMIGFNIKDKSFQLNIFPLFIFCMWDQYSIYINTTFLFITFGFKVNLYDSTYM